MKDENRLRKYSTLDRNDNIAVIRSFNLVLGLVTVTDEQRMLGT
jgi:hypothetical protein